MNKINTEYLQELNFILDNIKKYHTNFTKKKENKIIQAFLFAEKAHEGQKRASGEPYFIHAIEATNKLLEIKPDTETICACLLHDVIEDTKIEEAEIRENFGDRILFLCKGVEKVASVRIDVNEDSDTKIETLQKLFIAMGQDVRVIFIKLADRIHNLTTLKFLPKKKQERIAHESLEIYAPIAEKFGLFNFKSDIEFSCFWALYPKEFKKIKKEVIASRKERKTFVDKGIKEITSLFKKEKNPYLRISGREKTLFSVYKKMEKKGMESAGDVYDLLAIRVIVTTVEECYRTLGLLHSHWRSLPGRFKDYISVPKPNGYQSLHTTVLGLGGSKLPTEIQIRTEQMNEDAEFGPAAHWAYKNKGHSNFDDAFLKKTSWVGQNISSFKDKTADEFFMNLSDNITATRIYAFTPKGDIHFLPEGSTLVDFAYAIHTDIGNSCCGGTVDGVIKPLTYKLKNGDVVSILTKKGQVPNAMWMQFVKTNRAKNKIRRYVRPQTDEEIATLIKEQKEKTVQKKLRIFKHEIKAKKNKKWRLSIDGLFDIPYKYATCCDVKPSKEICAYKKQGSYFSIHCADCEELKKLDKDRIFDAYFEYGVVIYMEAYFTPDFSYKYKKIISDYVRLDGVDMKMSDDKEIISRKIYVSVRSEAILRELLSKLEKMKNVISVRAVDL